MSIAGSSWGTFKPPLGCQPNMAALASLGIYPGNGAAWLFNENGGHALDWSGNGYHAAVSNFTTYSWGPGRFRGGNALHCTSTGSTNLVTIPTLVTTTTYSFALWLTPTTLTANYQNLFGASGSDAYFLRSTGALDRYKSGDNLSTGTIGAGVQSMFALSADAGIASLYINGLFDSTLYSAGAPTDSISIVSMFSDSASETFNGSYDLFLIAPGTVWTFNQIQKLYTDPFWWMEPQRRLAVNVSAVIPSDTPSVWLLTA